MLENLNNLSFYHKTGKVVQYVGLIVEATGPDVCIGDLCSIIPKNGNKAVKAEVVGFKDNKVLLMPFGKVKGISIGCDVVSVLHSSMINVSEGLLGRVVDAFGEPLDDKGEVDDFIATPLYREPHNPLSRESILDILESKVASIDLFTTLGKGQRVGIFAGSGVGKSSLIGMMSNRINCDVNVIALIGERGKEVTDFIEQALGDQGMQKTIVVVATSDQPALVRSHAVYSAMAIAEYFCEKGKDVLLTLDSITRFAMAQREIGLAIGEPPTTKGYTPSVFSSLSPIVERAGNFKGKGSISALITVLVEGDDLSDPIADYMRGILDGHIVLSRDLANKGHYPAVDILNSKSRLFESLVPKEKKQIIYDALKLYSNYLESKDLVDMGAYVHGQNTLLDEALDKVPKLQSFLKQNVSEASSYESSFSKLSEMMKV